MNENRFYLRTKIPIKITIRDKKFIKKFHGEQFSLRMGGEGEGGNFPGGNSPEAIFWGGGGGFPEGILPRTN